MVACSTSMLVVANAWKYNVYLNKLGTPDYILDWPFQISFETIVSSKERPKLICKKSLLHSSNISLAQNQDWASWNWLTQQLDSHKHTRMRALYYIIISGVCICILIRWGASNSVALMCVCVSMYIVWIVGRK